MSLVKNVVEEERNAGKADERWLLAELACRLE